MIKEANPIRGQVQFDFVNGGLIVPNIKNYPAPVEPIWVDSKKKYQLGEENYYIFREQFETLVEQPYFSEIKKWLALPREEFLSKFVVIVSGTRLNKFSGKDSNSVQLFGNLIALPEKLENMDYPANYEQRFFSIARITENIPQNNKGKVFVPKPQYEQNGVRRNMRLGTVFGIGLGKACLLSDQIRPNSRVINY